MVKPKTTLLNQQNIYETVFHSTYLKRRPKYCYFLDLGLGIRWNWFPIVATIFKHNSYHVLDNILYLLKYIIWNMIDHVFKRENAQGKCAVCESFWPPAGDTISDFIRCQKCGKWRHDDFFLKWKFMKLFGIDQVVHGSCKRISSIFLSCSDKRCRRVKTKGTCNHCIEFESARIIIVIGIIINVKMGFLPSVCDKFQERIVILGCFW